MAVMPAGKAVVICVPSLIHNRLALVDRDIGTTDETGPTRGKKGHHGRDLAWFASLNKGRYQTEPCRQSQTNSPDTSTGADTGRT